MAQFNLQKNWWVVIVAAAVVGIAVLEITDQWLPDLKSVGTFLAFGLLGAAFCWVYTVNRERLWWAIIPGLGLFTLLAAPLAAALQTKDENESSWLGVMVLGIGAAIIGVVLKRMDAKFILYAVAMIIFIITVAMIPIAWIVRGILIAVVVVASGFFLLRVGSKMAKPG